MLVNLLTIFNLSKITHYSLTILAWCIFTFFQIANNIVHFLIKGFSPLFRIIYFTQIVFSLLELPTFSFRLIICSLFLQYLLGLINLFHNCTFFLFPPFDLFLKISLQFFLIFEIFFVNFGNKLSPDPYLSLIPLL